MDFKSVNFVFLKKHVVKFRVNDYLYYVNPFMHNVVK